MTPPTDTRRASGHTYGLKLSVVLMALVACGAMFSARAAAPRAAGGDAELDAALSAVLGQHVAGVPQLAPASANVGFDGPGGNEDFGLEQVTGSAADRYAFRTSPLRNVALQPAFFHNGAFTRLEDALRFHLDAASGASAYDPAGAGVDEDLRGPLGPAQPVLDRLDPLLQTPVALTGEEFRQLLSFVRDGPRDPRATHGKLRKLIPDGLLSGRPVQQFQ